MRTFCYGSQSSQEGDLYLPSVLPCPILCLLHGGFWRMPYGRDELTLVAKDLASRGYAVWNVEYRRLGAPGGGWPGTFDDVASAIDYLAILEADGIDLDLKHVIVAGHSAGGQLALWIAAQNKSGGAFARTRVHPVAAVGLAPISDLASACRLGVGKGAVREFLGGLPSLHPDRYAATSPIQLLPLGVNQLIIHGVRDEALPVDLSRKYVETARKSGDNIEFVELPDAGHMDFLDPTSKAYAAFCVWLNKEYGHAAEHAAS